jgi:peptidoglycan/LPS O-acetylase OafA/YrhL
VSSDKQEQRVFHTLDGLRGVAALFVAMRHTSFFHHVGVYGGYLAVDLFFVLSGFVIAHAYERRLAAGLSVRRFLAMRYLRLWPVYVLGAVLGLIAALLHAFPGKDNLTLAQVAHTAPFALVMLPGPHIKTMLYPVNSVAWSLGLELLVNAAYALAWRPLLRPAVLGAVLASSAIALIGAVWWFGKLDVGFTWADAWGGVPRVLFSFTAGLAIYRLHRRWPPRLRVPAWAPMALLPVLLWVKVDPVVYPLVCVIGVFPVLVLAAIETRPAPGAVRVFTWLGLASYPLYALHKPAGEIVTWLLRHHAPQTLSWTVWIGAPYLVVLAAACLLVERFYDRPVRRGLTAGLDRAIAAIRRRSRRGASEDAELAAERT